MSINEEMQSLAQGIINSFERRTGEVAALRQGTQRETRELNSARRALEQQLRAERARTGTERRSRVHAWLGGVRGDVAGAKKAWGEMTTTLQAQRQTPAAQGMPSRKERPAPPAAEVARKATQIKARPRKR